MNRFMSSLGVEQTVNTTQQNKSKENNSKQKIIIQIQIIRKTL